MINLLLSLFLALASPALDTRVEITLQDGRVLTGTVTLEQVTIRTIFGEAHVYLDEIDCIDFGRHDHIVLLDGQVLTGHIDLDEVVLRQGPEYRIIPRPEIATLAVEPGRPTATRDEAPAGDGVRAVLTLADGHRVEGVLQPLRLEMTTDFGRAEVEIDKVESIRFGRVDRVRTGSGTLLEGRIQDFRIRLRTADDVKTFERADLRGLEIRRLA